MVAVITTLIIGVISDFYLWVLSQCFAGLSIAAAMIIGSSLILNWLIRKGYKRELGIHYSGLGIALASSAVMVMQKNSLDAQRYWVTALACGLLH